MALTLTTNVKGHHGSYLCTNVKNDFLQVKKAALQSLYIFNIVRDGTCTITE